MEKVNKMKIEYFDEHKAKEIAIQIIDTASQFDNEEAKYQSLVGLIAMELVRAFKSGEKIAL